MRSPHRLAAIALAVVIGAAFTPGADARPLRHRARTAYKGPKTHRILAGSKSIRINNVGQVITNEHP